MFILFEDEAVSCRFAAIIGLNPSEFSGFFRVLWEGLVTVRWTTLSIVFSTYPGRQLATQEWIQGADFWWNMLDWLETGQPLGSESGASCQSLICPLQSLKQSCQLTTLFLEMDSAATGYFGTAGEVAPDSPGCPPTFQVSPGKIPLP